MYFILTVYLNFCKPIFNYLIASHTWLGSTVLDITDRGVIIFRAKILPIILHGCSFIRSHKMSGFHSFTKQRKVKCLHDGRSTILCTQWSLFHWGQGFCRGKHLSSPPGVIVHRVLPQSLFHSQHFQHYLVELYLLYITHLYIHLQQPSFEPAPWK